MVLKFTEEQEMFRDTARRFAQKEVEPVANQIDRDERTPTVLYQRCAELSFYGLYTSEEYDGLGKNLTSACLVLEEISKASPSLGGLLSVQIVLCPATLDIAGSEDQKRRYLSAAARGEKAMAWSSTEPSGTCYHRAHQTRITRDGNGYRLSGVKIFCTQGEAETYLVFGRSEADGKVGYGGVIVEKSMQGLQPAPYEDKLGWRGTNTGTVNYNDIYIPAENLIGDFYTARSDVGLANSMGSLGHCASSLGCLEGLFDKTVSYVKDRELYGGPMSRLQPISYWLAEIWAKMEACRAMLYAVTQAYDAGRPAPVHASACKAYLCDTVAECTGKLLQMWGGAGIMNSTGVNRYFRDARAKMVAEGSSEIHYDIVASTVLGIPSHVSFDMN
ncbi:MAG: acyl-CoA/acyl-ACP dehydrogenase [Alphaproteobacteria bacterium]|nr:acyl-CoA/acyl-ACP dehydrogenase [Alphaproteobacteria bacterium]